MKTVANTQRQSATRTRVTRLLVILCWVPYSVALIGRVVFMIWQGGMEWGDGSGSPLLFMVGMAVEFVVLAVPALLLSGLIVVLRRKHTPAPASSAAPSTTR